MAEEIATGLPDLTLLPGTVIQVQVDGGSTVASLAVHGFQLRPAAASTANPILLPAERRSGR